MGTLCWKDTKVSAYSMYERVHQLKYLKTLLVVCKSTVLQLDLSVY